jgi:hypothetical protein
MTVKRSDREGRWADMPSARVRFAIEAAFLLVVAAGAAPASLSPLRIILLMFVAWVLVAFIERASSRRSQPSEPQAAGAERRWSWRSRREEVAEPAPSPLAAIEEHPAPTHVRRLEPQPSQLDEELAEILAAETLASAPGPAVTKRTLDLTGLEEPEVAPPPPPPAPEPEPEPEPAPVPVAAPVVPEPVAVAPPPPPRVEPPAPPPPPQPPREWNLWDLERLARDRAGDAARDEEWSALFVHLRQYAGTDGLLPKEFDGLVRDSFAELIHAA